MQISNDCDHENIARLEEQIHEIVCGAEPPFSHREVLFALMSAIGGVISTITCPECRAASGQGVKKALPDLIDYVVKGPSGEPCGEGRLH
jgi:hypothetical protein